MSGVTANSGATRAPRDLRLDFFRGLAMFIILVSHTDGNTWTLWIPARFGFSDATEIFVFCSGMASALAFGSIFVSRGWAMGAARVAFRVWQVYWAHISVFMITALLMVFLDWTKLGPEGSRYADWYPVRGIFTDTKVAMAGLFSLTYVPGLFDILPMYLGILAMIPFMMLVYRIGGKNAVFGAVFGVWFAGQLALWHYFHGDEPTHALGRMASSVGSLLSFMVPPSNPWGKGTWFFNPFTWQLIFFTGFSFGMKWLTVPAPTRKRVMIAVWILILTVPFAWFRIYNGGYLPADWALREGIFAIREHMLPLIDKTGFGLFRYIHFLALAWLAWIVVGKGGEKLFTGFTPPPAVKRKSLLALFAVIAILTIPYAYAQEIAYFAPKFSRWLFIEMDSRGLIMHKDRIGLPQIAHLIALVMLAWTAIGPVRRAWVTGDAFVRVVPVIRKVGTQSLAVFLVSIFFSRLDAWWLDVIGKDVWTRLLVNSTGFAVLIATAYTVGWFKSQPWRQQRTPQSGQTGTG